MREPQRRSFNDILNEEYPPDEFVLEAAKQHARFKQLNFFSIGIFALVGIFLGVWAYFTFIHKGPIDLKTLVAQEKITAQDAAKIHTELCSGPYTQLRELASIFFTPLLPVFSLLIGYVVGERRSSNGSN